MGGGGGAAGGWIVSRFKERRGPGKKREDIFYPILEDKVYAMTLPNQLTPKRIKIFLNDCRILQKRLSNEQLQTQDLWKQESI